jgi:hypothetical protein
MTDFLLPIYFLIGVGIVLFFSRKRKKEIDLSNELARLVDGKKYTEAIALGEKSGVHEKSFHLLRLNLMAAYFRAGRIDDAKRFLETLNEKDFGSAKWILHSWQKKIRRKK